MSKSYDMDLSEYVPFQHVSDEDFLKATIFNRSRMSDTGCWLWTASKDTGGYGLFYANNRYYKAHRFSYELFKGRIPKGLHVLHRCDTPACVNPAHLRPGTVKENAADRESRGRRDVRGEQIGTSKLTENDVREIKAASNVSQKVLAEMYGVKPTHIWRIRTGKSWAHIKPVENVDGR